eukprot:g65366.t1
MNMDQLGISFAVPINPGSSTSFKKDTNANFLLLPSAVNLPQHIAEFTSLSSYFLRNHLSSVEKSGKQSSAPSPQQAL